MPFSYEHCMVLNPPVKHDGYHGLLLFKEHNPLVYTTPAIANYLEVGASWAIACHHDSKQTGGEAATFYLFTWNCLSGSLVHGHAHVSLHARFPPPRLALLLDASQRYQATGNNYFEDLWSAHSGLGLGLEVGATRIMASLHPIKERECLILAPADVEWYDLAQAIRLVLTTLQADLPHAMLTFNMAIYSAPLVPTVGWKDFPILVRIVDRGWSLLGVADMGSMELYAESIVANDPFVLAGALRQRAKESV